MVDIDVNDVNFDNIPPILQSLPQWVGFTRSYDGKKIPMNVKNNRPASISDPTTWSTFEEVKNAVKEKKCPMIGFALQESNNLVFIDLDCHDERCSSEESKKELVAKYETLVKETSNINTYAEKSVSGKGIHLIANCMLDSVYKTGGSQFNDCLEIYNSKRFVIFTGHKLNDFPISNSLDVRGQILNLQRKYFLQRGESDSKVTQDFIPISLSQVRDDDEVIKIGMKIEEFKLLWEGKWQSVKQDNKPKYAYQHAADFRLVRYLIFLSSNCPEQVKRLFKKSPCYQEYGKNGKYIKYESDIDNDIKTCSTTCTAVYDPEYAKKTTVTNLEPVSQRITSDKFDIFLNVINGADDNGKRKVKNTKLYAYLINYVYTYRNQDIIYYPNIFKKISNNNLNECTNFVFQVLENRLIYSQRYNEFFVFNGKKFVMYNKDSLVHLLLQILQMYKHSVFLWFSTECLLNLDDSLEKLALTYFDIADKLVSVRTANDILTNLKGMCVSYDLNFYYQTPYLNCENGELNLETRKLEPHNPLDRLYKVTSCEYDPDAKAPVFESMIQKLLPDAQTRKEFQKAVGLCVAKEQFVYAKKIFVILLGDSNTGKTTLLNTICSVFGDYKAKIDNSILLQSKNEINRGPEFFDLIDSLFINSSEFDSRHSLDASRIKQLTGNTEISVRNNYSTTMTKFNMIGVIYVDSNQKPYFNDEAMFSRLRVFPFKVKITQKDPTLSTKLQSEKSGILNWILAGLDMLMKDGEVFETPEMLNEKNDYKDNMSIVTQFSKDCLQKIPFPGCREVTSTVYTTFLNWCKQNNFKPTSRPLFYDELEKTYPRKKSSKEYFTNVAFTPLGSLYSMMQEMSPTEFAKELRIRREEDEGDYLHKRSQYFGAAWPFFKKSANFGTIESWPKFSDYIDYTAIMGIGSLMEDDYNAKSKLIQDFYQKHGLELTDAHFNKICDIWGVDEDKVKRLKVKYPKSMLDEKRT